MTRLENCVRERNKKSNITYINYFTNSRCGFSILQIIIGKQKYNFSSGPIPHEYSELIYEWGER